MDIDKLGLSTMNFKKDGSNDFKEGSDKYYQNQLIKDYITLLTDKNSHHILHRSIDNDTKLLKDVLAEIETSSSKPEQPYGFYSLSTQTERKNDYITGKIGIGPFALNNNSHILTMLYEVKFKEFDTSIMRELGLTDLSIHKDIDGNSIMSWLSALINAHVDIAKDPYISRLNVNQFTYNLVNTLIRTGLGKKTFYFTTQPIIKEIAKAYINAGSAFMADQNKAQYQLQKEAVEKVAENRFKDETLNGCTFEQLVEGVQDPQDVAIKPIVNDYIKQIFDGGTLKTNANKSFKEAKGVDKLSANQVQMLMYLAYLQFEPYALSVSNLVKYSKIDTKKHGKSYIEQQVFLKGFKDLFYNEEGTGLFEESGIRRLAENSYIALKTINAISMTKNILKGQFLQSTNAFNNGVQQVLNMIGRSDSKSVDLHTKISKAIMASIKSEFINQYAKDISNGNPTYIRDLVSESEEDLQYEQSAKSNRIKVIGTPKYDLSTYIVGGKADVEFTHEGNTWHFQYNIIGYDRETNELIVDTERKVDNVGKLHLSGGKNTIYDRFVRLAAELRDDPEYKDVLDSSGEPYNKLLRSIVPGKEFRYQAPASTGVSYAIPEMQDTYPTLKFVKLFNALDNNGVESNYIIDGWDELLHDTKHPKLKKFAEDLVVYAFVTSGDQGGFTKFFKQVPFSWRKESGYGDFINRKLVEFQTEDISTEQLQDAILNNWFDNQLVPTYRLSGQDGPNFMVYSANRQATGYRAESKFPLILAALRNKNGVLEPSIDPNTAPVFIKVPRREEEQAKDSQRRFTVFKRVSYGMRKSSTGDWIHYPIYIKVEPKGNLLRGNYLMTEYGREDSTNKEYVANENGLKAMYVLGDFIKDSTIQEYSMKWGNVYAQMVEDMNYRDLFVNTYESNINEFDKAVRANSLVVDREVTTENEAMSTKNKSSDLTNYQVLKHSGDWSRYEAQNNPDVLYIFTDNTDRNSGSGVISDDSWYSKKYGTGHHYPTITAAVVRGLDNARPISTQRWYHYGAKGKTGRWTDADVEEFESVVRDELQEIVNEFNTGKYKTIMFPDGDGLFNGNISNITRERTPQLYQTLGELLHEFGFDSMLPSDFTDNQNLPGSDTKINIYAGTGENADLSNFAERPFTIKGSVIGAPDSNKDYSFKTVEHAFQAAKTFYTDLLEEEREPVFKEIVEAKTAMQARALGKRIPKLDRNDWDTYSSEIMKDLIKASFEQNPQALQRLLATGNATLTHTQDRGKWGKEFPRLLMEVREELRESIDNDTANMEMPYLSEWASSSEENNSSRFLTKEEVKLFRLGTSAYKLLKKNKLVRKENGKYYIQQGATVTNKGGESYLKYDLANEELYQKIFLVLKQNGFNPDEIISRFDKHTGELRFVYQDKIYGMNEQHSLNLDLARSLISNESSVESAEQVLYENDFDLNDVGVQEVLGQFIKKICKGD